MNAEDLIEPTLAGSEFYIVLGKSNYPISNQLFTEEDIRKMAQLPQAVNWSFIPIEAPWFSSRWSQAGGRGVSPYPKGLQQTTVRVPKNIAYQVKQYAVWLSHQGK